MPRVKKLDLGMTALDELFMNDKERAENKLPKIFDIPLSEIDDFPDHPYRVLDDEDMQNLMESMRHILKTTEYLYSRRIGIKTVRLFLCPFTYLSSCLDG